MSIPDVSCSCSSFGLAAAAFEAASGFALLPTPGWALLSAIFCALHRIAKAGTITAKTVARTTRILSVLGGQSFRQCLFTSEKSIIFSNVWINGLTHFFQCFSWARLGLDKAQFWANYSIVFCWAGLGLGLG